MASCPPSLGLYYSSQIPHTAIAYFCGGNVAPGTWLRYYLLNPFPPFSPPLHLQRTCLLWCVGYDLQHGIMPGPCSYSCVTGKMSVSLQHPGLHMDEFPALDARPQCIFCDAMFHFTCWKTVEATDILSDQHFIRHSPMPFSPGPSSSFSPSCPSLSTPPSS